MSFLDLNGINEPRMKSIPRLFLSTIILLTHGAASASTWENLHVSFLAGSGYSHVRASQNIWLANTPEPGLENTYTGDSKQNGTFILGLAVEKSFTNLKVLESAVGLEADYLRNPSVTGVVLPMVNVATDFDRLNYAYNMTSYLLQATVKLSKPNLYGRMGGTIQAGAGCAFNQLSDYTESSPAGSSAAPMLDPFGNHANSHIAYSLGAGITYLVGESARFAIGYRYINTGEASLRTSPIQQTSNHLSYSPLNHHLLIISLTV